MSITIPATRFTKGLHVIGGRDADGRLSLGIWIIADAADTSGFWRVFSF